VAPQEYEGESKAVVAHIYGREWGKVPHKGGSAMRRIGSGNTPTEYKRYIVVRCPVENPKNIEGRTDLNIKPGCGCYYVSKKGYLANGEFAQPQTRCRADNDCKKTPRLKQGDVLRDFPDTHEGQRMAMAYAERLNNSPHIQSMHEMIQVELEEIA